MSHIDIPTNVASAINPELENPIEYSHCFNAPFNFEDGNNIIINLPFIEGLVWTHFKYSYPGPCTEKLFITVASPTCSIHMQPSCTSNTWHTLRWPIPSINTDLKISIIKPEGNLENRIAFKLVGFTNLIPIERYYFLLDNNNSPKFTITDVRDSTISYGYNYATNNLEVTDEDYTIATSEWYLDNANYYSDESE